MTHGKARSAWPELLYRFVEHYKWEPQHLAHITTEQFYERIRRQEPPLNFLFNVLLRCSSSETILAILKQFGLNDLSVNEQFQFEFPWETGFTQPDVRIESANARVFIEIKVSASIELKQVQKYLALHALMDSEAEKKKPYLLFLTGKQFKKCWKPTHEESAVHDVQGFLKQKTASSAVPVTLENELKDKGAISRYEAVKQEVNYGAATWSSVGKCLKQISSQWHSEGTHDIESRIVDDFLQDLGERGLLT
jgi:hypothetical protein